MKAQVELAPAAACGVLSELVYVQVRSSIDLARIALLEMDLVESLGRTYERMGDDDPDDPPLELLAGAMVEEAWRRVEAEWRDQRQTFVGEEGEPCRPST